MMTGFRKLLRRLRRSLPASLAALLLANGAAGGQTFGPRPLSPAERQVVALSVLYFTHGAPAWWNYLSADSPLRARGQEDAVAEIQARLGPPTGASWHLGTAAPSYGPDVAVISIEHPSDFDDTVVLEMVDRNGWRIHRIRSRIDPPAQGAPTTRAGSLAPLREALAEGRMTEIERLLSSLPSEGPAARIARLWEVQLALESYDLERAEELLGWIEKRTPGTPLPLAALLRARLDYSRSEDLTTAVSYDDALRFGIDHDGLRLESLQTQALMGFLDEVGYRKLFEMGSRRAEVYYTLARTAVYYEEERAESWLRVAWQLGPVERREILEDPLLAQLTFRENIIPLLALDSPDEPRLGPQASDLRPFAFPEAAHLLVSGNLLTIFIGDGEIEIPGGGALAPRGTVWEDAGSRQRRREETALAELEGLVTSARSPSALTNAALRERLETAATALASRKRWDDLLRLTDGIADRATRAGPVLGRLRAVALSKRARLQEAVKLLSELGESAEASRRRDPGALYQLAELCVEHGRYDLAIHLIRKADEMVPGHDRSRRALQIELDRRLATSFGEHKTAHFVLRHPPEVTGSYLRHLVALLEAELQRLSKWVPVRYGHPIHVSLFPWDEFSQAYGSETLGLFDGRMRIPFVARASVQAQLDTVVTHELAHAMIDAYAGENVPGWLHEGLAQHVEPEQETSNPIPDLRREARLLSLPILDAIFTGYGEEETVVQAYLQSLWRVHYVEARYGRRGLQDLMQAFATEDETDVVLQRVFGTSAAEFDQAFWSWGLQEAPRTWTVEVPDYFREAETEKDPRAEPKVGIRLPEIDYEAIDQEIDEHLDKIRDWHRRYSTSARPVKKALQTIRGTMDGTARARLGPACRELFAAASAALDDESSFSLPHRDIGETLKRAYAYYRSAALACNKGDFTGLRVEIGKAEREIARAAEVLAIYGIEP